jgi:hypothetical protein
MDEHEMSTQRPLFFVEPSSYKEQGPRSTKVWLKGTNQG